MAEQAIYRGSMRGGLIHIKELGFEPQTVIDVGAALGTFELYEVFPKSRHFLIEPISENEPYLAQICKKIGNAEYIIAAATRESETVTLIVDPALVHSSVSERLKTSEESLYTRKIPGITLDKLCKEKKLQPPYLIKVDVDGLEVDVLAGATQILQHTEYVIVEVSLFGQMYEVINFMKSQGFIAYDIVNMAWRPLDGALWQCDMAFVKETGLFRKNSSYVKQEQVAALSAPLQLYRQQLIDYIEKNYSDRPKIEISDTFKLRDINLLIFPDWSQSEEFLVQNLISAIREIVTHPNKKQMTLLIDTSNIADEDADLAVSSVVMSLLMEEDLDVAEGPEIVLLGKLSANQWEALLPRIHSRIVLENENKQAIAQVRAETIPLLELNSLSNKRAVQSETAAWELRE